MTNGSDSSTKQDHSALARHAEQPPSGLLREFWDFLKQNKKWWLTPIILMLLLFGALIFLGSTVTAPFIYTLF